MRANEAKKEYWIGATDLKKKGKFLFSDKTNPMLLDKIKRKRGGRCVTISLEGQRLRAVPCNSKRIFLCRLKMNKWIEIRPSKNRRRFLTGLTISGIFLFLAGITVICFFCKCGCFKHFDEAEGIVF